MENYRNDPELMVVLEGASAADLRILIDLITDSNRGRISLSSEAQKSLHETAAPAEQRFLIAEEIQKFGANTMVSLFRGGKASYIVKSYGTLPAKSGQPQLKNPISPKSKTRSFSRSLNGRWKR